MTYIPWCCRWHSKGAGRVSGVSRLHRGDDLCVAQIKEISRESTMAVILQSGPTKNITQICCGRIDITDFNIKSRIRRSPYDI
uniref:Bm14495 n=1 Tax=Brugia malayi TaxID=6279 RepID=A0A1I9G695_BRUMA|nr:Bm14495 [Brugia malayi]